MTAGLPGVGIGGIFYLLCALFMPLTEIINTLRGRSSVKRWRMVAQQFGILCGIVGAFWGTGWALKALLRELSAALVSVSPHLSHAAMRESNIFKVQPFFLSLGVLAAVIGVLSVANYLLDRRKAANRSYQRALLVKAVFPGGFPFRRRRRNLRLEPPAASESRAFAQRRRR
jgi:hypothetical protein